MNAVVELPIVTEVPSANSTLVALTPSDMRVAQHQLGEFIGARKASVGAEFDEMSAALESAVKNGWGTKALRNAVNKLARRQTFYDKLGAAVEAGYVIMPSLPMDVIAIRTRAHRPRSADSTWSAQFEQQAQALPEGAGQYQNPKPTVESTTETDDKGKRTTTYFPVAFEDDLEMPVELCKPALLDASKAAMARKLFDEIGVVRDDHRWGRRGDPMIVGTILDPTRRGRRFAFFIAWALPLDAI